MNDPGVGEAQSTGKSSGPRRKSRSERTNPMPPPNSTNGRTDEPEPEPPPQEGASWRRQLRRLSWLRRVRRSWVVALARWALNLLANVIARLVAILVTATDWL